MKLYHRPGACSTAPWIVATELGLTCEIVVVTNANKDELLKFNPRGQVPTLVLDNGQVLTEGAVIMSYLSDLKPEMNLMPKAGTWERYKAQEALNYVATEFHKGIGILFNPEFNDEAKTALKGLAAKKLTALNTHFAKNQFMTGTSFTPADAYCYVVTGWTKYVGIDMTPYPNVLAFCERMAQRPAVQKVQQMDSTK